MLNLDDAEVAAFSVVNVDRDGTTAGCLSGAAKICGRAFFDTGAAGLRVICPTSLTPWPNGTPAEITVGTGATTQTMGVSIGRRDQASGLQYVRGGSDTRRSLGFAPYFHWSVLYDADHHRVGVKPRG